MKALVWTCLAIVLSAGVASAATIGFDDLKKGRYEELAFDDLTLKISGGIGKFTVVDDPVGSPISGQSIIRSGLGVYTPSFFTATFNEGLNIHSFSIATGDMGGDIDNVFLEAYDASMNLIGSDSFLNPAGNDGGGILSVMTTEAIAMVKFWDSDPFPGAMYFDDLTYYPKGAPPVPEPASIVLMGVGLFGLAYARRKYGKS